MTLAAGTETRLTHRQIEVLRIYASSGSTKLTARTLGLSASTIRNTLGSIRIRLAVDATVQAVMIVFGEAA